MYPSMHARLQRQAQIIYRYHDTQSHTAGIDLRDDAPKTNQVLSGLASAKCDNTNANEMEAA